MSLWSNWYSNCLSPFLFLMYSICMFVFTNGFNNWCVQTNTGPYFGLTLCRWHLTRMWWCVVWHCQVTCLILWEPLLEVCMYIKYNIMCTNMHARAHTHTTWASLYYIIIISHDRFTAQRPAHVNRITEAKRRVITIKWLSQSVIIIRWWTKETQWVKIAVSYYQSQPYA